MRPRVDIDSETRKRIKNYAQVHGVTTRRAYAELLRMGLDVSEIEA